jgi:hypothetical protein
MKHPTLVLGRLAVCSFATTYALVTFFNREARPESPPGMVWIRGNLSSEDETCR